MRTTERTRDAGASQVRGLCVGSAFPLVTLEEEGRGQRVEEDQRGRGIGKRIPPHLCMHRRLADARDADACMPEAAR